MFCNILLVFSLANLHWKCYSEHQLFSGYRRRTIFHTRESIVYTVKFAVCIIKYRCWVNLLFLEKYQMKEMPQDKSLNIIFFILFFLDTPPEHPWTNRCLVLMKMTKKIVYSVVSNLILQWEFGKFICKLLKMRLIAIQEVHSTWSEFIWHCARLENGNTMESAYSWDCPIKTDLVVRLQTEILTVHCRIRKMRLRSHSLVGPFTALHILEHQRGLKV